MKVFAVGLSCCSNQSDLLRKSEVLSYCIILEEESGYATEEESTCSMFGEDAADRQGNEQG